MYHTVGRFQIGQRGHRIARAGRGAVERARAAQRTVERRQFVDHWPRQFDCAHQVKQPAGLGPADIGTQQTDQRGIFAQRPQIRFEVSMLGLDGLAAIRATRPDLVLLDMQLPDISGLELLRHFKNDDDVAGIPVIVVSADATAARMQQALTLGAVHYVTKPLALEPFLAVIDEVLQGLETQWTM